MADFGDDELRAALGRFATGVTVVTTMTGTGPLGITVNSFASVSLRPPLILWSPARRSKRFPAFEAASHFAVHVLSHDQRGLAERFARSGNGFADLDYSLGAGDAPLFDGCAARFECRHAARYDGGDHLIVVGEVIAVLEENRAPLIFHRGSFSALP